MGEVTAAPRSRPEDRVDWPQVRVIFAANWLIWLNRFRQRPWQLVLQILFMAMFAGFAAIASGVLGFWIHEKRFGAEPAPDLAAAAVHATFLVVLFMLVATAVLGFRGNEFLDVTKLFVFPVGHRTVFAATLACLMGSGAVVVFGLPLFGAALGYAGSPLEAFLGLGAALLLLLVAVTLGQFLLLTFLNVFRSRKWRDLSMILVPLVFGAPIVAINVMGGSRRGFAPAVAFFRWFAPRKDWTLVSPSWWAANAVTGEEWTRFLPALGLVAAVVWLVRASAVMQERAFLGEVAEDVAAESVAAKGIAGRIAARIPGRLGALVEKELAILRREPAVRSILIGQAMYPVFWGGVGVWRLLQGGTTAVAKFAPAAGVVAYPLLLMELGLVMNLLGLEGGGAVHSLLLPVKRRLLLLGKDVAYLLVFGTLNAAVVVVVTIAAYVYVQGSAAGCAGYALLGALEGYCVVALGLGIGNVASVVSPIRVAVKDRRAIRQQVAGRDGCLRNVIGLGAVFGAMIVAVPIALLFHAPYAARAFSDGRFQPAPWVPFVTVPLAVLLSLGWMLLGARIGGNLLQAGEEDVVARLGKSEE